MTSPHSAASPFKLLGAPNVQLETVKRGEDDDHSSTKATIIVRLFEQMGGHAKAVFKVYVPFHFSSSRSLSPAIIGVPTLGMRYKKGNILIMCRSGMKILKAQLANILEDSIDELKVQPTSSLSSGDGKDESEIKLSFRGFEIKTLKLTVEKAKGGDKKIKLGGPSSSSSSASSASAVQNDGWIKL